MTNYNFHQVSWAMMRAYIYIYISPISGIFLMESYSSHEEQSNYEGDIKGTKAFFLLHKYM
jgi:hypothetical protein